MVLRSISKTKKIALGLFTVLVLIIARYAWKFKHQIKALIQIKSALSNAKNMLESHNPTKELSYEKISRKFTMWNRISLPSVNTYKAKLQVKSITSAEKHELWSCLSKSVFSQLFLNIYSSEVFKMVFLVSTHLVSRKLIDCEDSSKLVEIMERLSNSIENEYLLLKFIEEKLSSYLDKIPLTQTINADFLNKIFEEIKLEINTVKRIPMPVFEFSIKIFPDDIKNDPDLIEFLQIYCLPDVQYCLLDRINQLYEVVYRGLVKEIEDNGKDVGGKKSIDFAKLVPIVNRQQGFTAWEPYDEIGRKIYFNLI